jgi:hypothetical protein
MFYDTAPMPMSGFDPTKLSETERGMGRIGDEADPEPRRRPGFSPRLPLGPNQRYSANDIDPPMTGTGSNQRNAAAPDGRQLVASFDTEQARYTYFAQVSPGTWTLMRRDNHPGNSAPAERVQTFSTAAGRYYFVVERYRNEAMVFRSDRQMLDPGWRNGMGESPKTSTADAQVDALRADMYQDQLARINSTNKAHYRIKQGGNVPRRKTGASR